MSVEDPVLSPQAAIDNAIITTIIQNRNFIFRIAIRHLFRRHVLASKTLLFGREFF
jgi:hypothetical protein